MKYLILFVLVYISCNTGMSTTPITTSVSDTNVNTVPPIKVSNQNDIKDSLENSDSAVKEGLHNLGYDDNELAVPQYLMLVNKKIYTDENFNDYQVFKIKNISPKTISNILMQLNNEERSRNFKINLKPGSEKEFKLIKGKELKDFLNPIRIEALRFDDGTVIKRDMHGIFR